MAWRNVKIRRSRRIYEMIKVIKSARCEQNFVPDIVAYALQIVIAMKLLRDNFQKSPEAFVRCTCLAIRQESE